MESILVSANRGPPGKWPLKWRDRDWWWWQLDVFSFSNITGRSWDGFSVCVDWVSVERLSFILDICSRMRSSAVSHHNTRQLSFTSTAPAITCANPTSIPQSTTSTQWQCHITA